MAISMNRYAILVLLLVAAAASYAVGFIAGFWLLIVVGGAFELAFWMQLILRRK